MYTVRVSAATVNGTGPATEWIAAETFENDLDGKHTLTLDTIRSDAFVQDVKKLFLTDQTIDFINTERAAA